MSVVEQRGQGSLLTSGQTRASDVRDGRAAVTRGGCLGECWSMMCGLLLRIGRLLETDTALRSQQPTGMVPGLSCPHTVRPPPNTSRWPCLTLAMSTLNTDTVKIGAYIETTGNPNNNNINFHQNAIAGPSLPRDIARRPCFNDAPLDFLSVNFTSRGREIALIIEFLERVYGDVPTRCLYGMHGVGKSQVSMHL